MSELTYGEHIEAKRKVIMREYTDKIHVYVRNITLDKEDLSTDGFLSNYFFDNNRLSDYKKLLLKDLTVAYKKKYGKLLDTLRT